MLETNNFDEYHLDSEELTKPYGAVRTREFERDFEEVCAKHGWDVKARDGFFLSPSKASHEVGEIIVNLIEVLIHADKALLELPRLKQKTRNQKRELRRLNAAIARFRTSYFAAMEESARRHQSLQAAHARIEELANQLAAKGPTP